MSSINYTREDAMVASADKIRIEKEISDWKTILDSQENVGMDGKLVDDEGFPRNDIDIVKVRTARQKIICLSNDHKAIMNKIAEILYSLHQQQKEALGPDQEPPEDVVMPNELPKAFASVAFVNIGSPAFDAGVRKDDLVVEFGTQNDENFKCLTDIGALVENSQNRNVRLKIIRAGQLLTMNLVPKLWSGRGLLGCKLIPLNLPPIIDR
jgi:26S proteasome non-ATPase regulatory subunit 9